ncbi:hypothetical protein Lal_00010096 [Lupinus albus]|uniref:Uncharacterized protein n=1 Tax=Lupinus albus TaxID=3870 RepID=A0A6A4NFN8_LUPAL|nr:hypothetical protein Lalb_Chr24g0398711 [Lupinus albus]KAF1859512.1 hypothetical protein Lal_00010096 [Lupinus albus]
MKIKIVNKKNRKEIEHDNINNMFIEKEREVAQLLVELSHVIFDLESPLLSSLPFTWGCKKLRSAIQDTPSKTTTCAHVPLFYQGGAAVAPPYEVTFSPATPLSLSLVDSDDKGQKTLPCKLSLKRKKEYYDRSIEDLTKSKASLNEEIENVKRYSEHLSDFNFKLKSRKQELSHHRNKSEAKKPKLENGCPINYPNSMAENPQHHQFQFQVSNSTQYVALMLNQNCGPSQICNNNNAIVQFQTSSFSVPSCSSTALGLVNNINSNLGPNGRILDLNGSSEEIIHVESRQPLDVNGINKDLNRVIAAQARQRRIQINKLKNHIGNKKTR